jgi:hypothetical protein
VTGCAWLFAKKKHAACIVIYFLQVQLAADLLTMAESSTKEQLKPKCVGAFIYTKENFTLYMQLGDTTEKRLAADHDHTHLKNTIAGVDDLRSKFSDELREDFPEVCEILGEVRDTIDAASKLDIVNNIGKLEKSMENLQKVASGTATDEDWKDGLSNASFQDILARAKTTILDMDAGDLIDGIASTTKAPNKVDKKCANLLMPF